MESSPPPPSVEAPAPVEAAARPPSWWRGGPVLYPDRYLWYVLASVMDIVVTVTVLVHYSAREVNSIAQASIEMFDTWGLIGLKFLTLIIVVLICEYIGRRNERLGRMLATIAIAASLMPVMAATTQVFWFWSQGTLQYGDGPARAPEFDE